MNVTSQAACRLDATCSGFNYWWSLQSCDLLDGARCEGPSVTFDADATYFILTSAF